MEPFLGEIRMFAGNFAPRDWAFCNGALLSIQQNTALFSLLGTNFGGDGRTTFALPDLQDRVPVFWGTGPGLTERYIGEAGGSAAVAIFSSEMGPHTHTVQAFAGTGANVSPENSLWAASSARDKQFAPAPADRTMAFGAIEPAGGGQQHPNQQPYLAVSYIIAMAGIFPARP